MSNPYDLGKEVGSILAESIFAEQKKDYKKRIVAVFAGRFQPFHAGHHAVYADMVRRFGKDNVYIATSNVVEPTKSPFSFDEKQTIISKMFDVPEDQIVSVKSPFAPEEVLSKFNPKTTAVVTTFSQKDAGRLASKQSHYYKQLPKTMKPENLEGYKDRGYYYVAPVHKMEIGGKNISGTVLRTMLGDPKVSSKVREKLFKRVYGKYDPEIFKLVTKRTRQSEAARKEQADQETHQTAQKERKKKHLKKYGGERVTNPETGKEILVRTALSYDKKHPAHRAAMALRGEAITIPVEIGDTILTGRFKNKKTVVKSISTDEHGMPVINGRKVATFRIVKPDKKEGILEYNLIGDDMISRVLLMKEGGAAGHMAHPFDDMSLTFGDLKTIVELGLEGHLNVESPVTEKLDGQNISVSWKDTRGVVFARNKSHTKNRGLNAMDVNGVKQMFAGRGSLSDAFSLAASDLQKGISSLTAKQRDKIFDNGRKFMSIEILFPATQNVIPYGHNMLVFHNTLEYDEKGNAIGTDADSGRMLAGMIKQINQNIQKTFTFTGPVVVELPRSKNFARRKGSYFGRIIRLQSEFRLKDSDTVMMWHQRWWEDFIQKQARKNKYNMSNKVFMGLLQRWAFQNLSGFSVVEMKRTIDNPKFLRWVLDFDKTGKQAQFKTNIAPFEKLFLQLGAEILQNAGGLLSASPHKAAQQLKKEVEKSANELSRTKNINHLSRFKEQLAKINAIGMDKLVPSEGIVFMFKGKIYKLTGAFAPINQLIGMVKYG